MPETIFSMHSIVRKISLYGGLLRTSHGVTQASFYSPSFERQAGGGLIQGFSDATLLFIAAGVR